MGESAFDSCLVLASVTINDGAAYIGDYAFSSCKSLASINLPDSITYIGEGAFRYCTSLTSITIPGSVKTTGTDTFCECTSLTSVIISYGVKTIDSYAFQKCTSLKSVVIPDSVTSIEKYAFSFCKSLTSIDLPNSITSIEEAAFYSCSGLRSIKIPDKIKIIRTELFSYCTNLTSVTIPNGVKSINSLAFCKCASLTSIVLPDSVSNIENVAFCYCVNLTNVTIPKNVSFVGGNAFCGCTSLLGINADENNADYKSVDGVLFTKDMSKVVAFPGGKVGSYAIPDGVTSIGVCAFYGCDNITSVIIPDGATSIESSAFGNYYAPKYITIPASVTSIKEHAFISNADLTILGYTGTTAETYANKNDIPFVDLNNISFNSDVTASATTKSVYLSWNKVAGATAYLVKSADGETQYTADSITKTSYNITGLKSGTQYQFQVYALINGEWYASSVVTATTVEEFKNLTATAGVGQITLNWDKITGATGYVVKSADGKTQYTKRSITANTYTVIGLNGNTQYKFKIWAYVNGKWYGSSVISETTLTPIEIKNLKATSGSKKITLTWDKVDGATGYLVKSNDGTIQYTEEPITTNYYTVTGLKNSTCYVFRVYACVDGIWYKSRSVSKTPTGQPQHVKATSGNQEVTLTWDKVDGATGYFVKDWNGRIEYTKKTIKTNSYTVTGLTAGTKYGFKVYACVDAIWYDSYYVTATPYVKINNITATAGNGQVDLTWNKVNNATGYVVKSADGKIQYTKNSIHKTSYTVTGLKNGTQYKFKVYAKVNGRWYDSKIVSKTPVAKPQNVKATAGNGQVKLTWDTVNGATGYLVKSADGAVQYTADPITENTYTVTGLTNGKQYKFKVYACVDGLQFASASVSKTPVAKPTNVVAVAGKEKITLAWDKVDGATAYQIKSADGTTLYTADNITENIYTVTKLDSNTTYKFKVYAYADGKWYASSTVSKTTFKSY